jgi:heat shock protein HslJ
MFAYPVIVEATNAKAAEDDTFALITNPDLIEVGQKLWLPTQAAIAATPPTPETASGLTLAVLKNATYHGIYDDPVQLTDGAYEGEPFVEGGAARPTVTFIDFYAFGDLNGDGLDDAAVFLAENSGGSGVFGYLAAVVDKEGQPVNVGTQLVGDRTQLKEVTVKNGQIVLNMITQGPNDPFCCPTLEVLQTFELQGEALVLVSTEEVGTLSAASLEDTTWALVSYGDYLNPTAVLADTEITIAFSTADGQISGSAGCNSYFAGFTEEAGGALSIGPVGSTMMACPEAIMNQETEYLSALEKVRQFQFFNGKLLIIYDGGFLTFEAK